MTMLTDWIDEAAEKYEWDHAEELGDGPSFKAGARAAIEKLQEMGVGEFDETAAYKKLSDFVGDKIKPTIGVTYISIELAKWQHAQLSALIAESCARIKELEEYKLKYEQQYNTGEMK